MRKIQTVLAALLVALSANVFGQSSLFRKLDNYCGSLSKEYDQITPARKVKLDELAAQLKNNSTEGKRSLLFASYDNSGASQLAQAWMEVAKENFHLTGLQISSGGVQTSAIHKEVIVALKNAGFKIEANAQFKTNPRYTVAYSWKQNTLLMFSKKYDNFQNPTSGFVTASTEENLAPVQGEAANVGLSYSVNTKMEDQSREIAREMFYLGQKIQNQNLLSHQQ